MKSILLSAIVFSVVLTNAEKCSGFGYELIMSVLESVHSNTRTVATKMDQLMDEQRVSKSTIQSFSTSIKQDLRSIRTKLDQLIDMNVAGEPRCPENAANGVYNLKPAYSSIPTFSVYCENGWIEIHSRLNGNLDFNRNWDAYRNGFGDLKGEHWLGLEKMYQITRVGSYELLVVMKSFDGVVKSAKYEGFRIGSESQQYQLNLKKFLEGDAGDSLIQHNTMKFSAVDRDNDLYNSSCAADLKSGWWFKSCYNSNLNGVYEKGKIDYTMTWNSFNSTNYCLKEARMMIRVK